MPAKRRMTPKSDALPIARIAGVFGLRGELKCDPTNAGRTLFSAGAHLLVRSASGVEERRELAAVREHQGRLLIRFAGVDDANAAARFAHATVFAPRETIAGTLGEGEYLDADLAGCMVVDETGTTLGCVERIEHYPASDMLVVDGKMLPMVRAFIVGIDVAAKRITVKDLPEDLL